MSVVDWSDNEDQQDTQAPPSVVDWSEPPEPQPTAEAPAPDVVDWSQPPGQPTASTPEQPFASETAVVDWSQPEAPEAQAPGEQPPDSVGYAARQTGEAWNRFTQPFVGAAEQLGRGDWREAANQLAFGPNTPSAMEAARRGDFGQVARDYLGNAVDTGLGLVNAGFGASGVAGEAFRRGARTVEQLAQEQGAPGALALLPPPYNFNLPIAGGRIGRSFAEGALQGGQFDPGRGLGRVGEDIGAAYQQGGRFSGIGESSGLSGVPVVGGPLGAVANFGEQMLTDPSNYLMGGMLGRFGTAGKAAQRAIEAPFQLATKAAGGPKIGAAITTAAFGTVVLGGLRDPDTGEKLVNTPIDSLIEQLPPQYQTTAGLLLPIGLGLLGAGIWRAGGAGLIRAEQATGMGFTKLPAPAVPVLVREMVTTLPNGQKQTTLRETTSAGPGVRFSRPGEIVERFTTIGSERPMGGAAMVLRSALDVGYHIERAADGNPDRAAAILLNVVDTADNVPGLVEQLASKNSAVSEKAGRALSDAVAKITVNGEPAIAGPMTFTGGDAPRGIALMVKTLQDYVKAGPGQRGTMADTVQNILNTKYGGDMALFWGDLNQRMANKIATDLGIRRPDWTNPTNRFQALVAQLQDNDAARAQIGNELVSRGYSKIASALDPQGDAYKALVGAKGKFSEAKASASTNEALIQIERAWKEVERKGKVGGTIPTRPDALDPRLAGTNVNAWLDAMAASKAFMSVYWLGAVPRYYMNNLMGNTVPMMIGTQGRWLGAVTEQKRVAMMEEIGLDLGQLIRSDEWLRMDSVRRDMFGQSTSMYGMPSEEGIFRRAIGQAGGTKAGGLAGKVVTAPGRFVRNIMERAPIFREAYARQVATTSETYHSYYQNAPKMVADKLVAMGLDQPTAEAFGRRVANLTKAGNLDELTRPRLLGQLDVNQIPTEFRQLVREKAALFPNDPKRMIDSVITTLEQDKRSVLKLLGDSSETIIAKLVNDTKPPPGGAPPPTGGTPAPRGPVTPPTEPGPRRETRAPYKLGEQPSAEPVIIRRADEPAVIPQRYIDIAAKPAEPKVYTPQERQRLTNDVTLLRQDQNRVRSDYAEVTSLFRDVFAEVTPEQRARDAANRRTLNWNDPEFRAPEYNTITALQRASGIEPSVERVAPYAGIQTPDNLAELSKAVRPGGVPDAELGRHEAFIRAYSAWLREMDVLPLPRVKAPDGTLVREFATVPKDSGIRAKALEALGNGDKDGYLALLGREQPRAERAAAVRAELAVATTTRATNAATTPADLPQNSDYYIFLREPFYVKPTLEHNVGGERFERVLGARKVTIPGKEQLDLFIARTNAEKNPQFPWVVSEAKSGTAIGRPGRTMAEAIESGKDTLSRLGDVALAKLIAEHVGEHGVSPRYESAQPAAHFLAAEIGATRTPAPAAPEPRPAVAAPPAAVPTAREPWQMTRKEYEARGTGLPEDHPLVQQYAALTQEAKTLKDRMLAAAGQRITNIPDLATRRTTIGELERLKPHTIESALKSPKVPRDLKDAYRAVLTRLEETSQAADAAVSHRAAVEQALAEGKPVPPEVLAEYPDLAKGAAQLTPEVPGYQGQTPRVDLQQAQQTARNTQADPRGAFAEVLAQTAPARLEWFRAQKLVADDWAKLPEPTRVGYDNLVKEIRAYQADPTARFAQGTNDLIVQLADDLTKLHEKEAAYRQQVTDAMRVRGFGSEPPIDAASAMGVLQQLPSTHGEIWRLDDGSEYVGRVQRVGGQYQTVDGHPLKFERSLAWAMDPPEMGTWLDMVHADAIRSVQSAVDNALNAAPLDVRRLGPTGMRAIREAIQEAQVQAKRDGVAGARSMLFGYDDRTTGQWMLDHYSPFSYWTVNHMLQAARWMAPNPGAFAVIAKGLQSWAEANKHLPPSQRWSIHLYDDDEGNDIRLNPTQFHPYATGFLTELISARNPRDDRSAVAKWLDLFGISPHFPIDLAMEAGQTYGVAGGQLSRWYTGNRSGADRARALFPQADLIRQNTGGQVDLEGGRIFGVTFPSFRQAVYGTNEPGIDVYYAGIELAKRVKEGQMTETQAKAAILSQKDGKPNADYQDALAQSLRDRGVPSAVRYGGLPVTQYSAERQRLDQLSGEAKRMRELGATGKEKQAWYRENPDYPVRGALYDDPRILRLDVATSQYYDVKNQLDAKYAQQLKDLSDQAIAGKITPAQWFRASSDIKFNKRYELDQLTKSLPDADLSGAKRRELQAQIDAEARARGEPPYIETEAVKEQRAIDAASRAIVDNYFTLQEQFKQPDGSFDSKGWTKARDQYVNSLSEEDKKVLNDTIKKNQTEMDVRFENTSRYLPNITPQGADYLDKVKSIYEAARYAPNGNPAAGRAALVKAGLPATAYEQMYLPARNPEYQAYFLKEGQSGPTTVRPGGATGAGGGALGPSAADRKSIDALWNQYNELKGQDTRAARQFYADNFDKLYAGAKNVPTDKPDPKVVRLENERAAIYDRYPKDAATNKAAVSQFYTAYGKRLDEINAALGKPTTYSQPLAPRAPTTSAPRGGGGGGSIRPGPGRGGATPPPPPRPAQPSEWSRFVGDAGQTLVQALDSYWAGRGPLPSPSLLAALRKRYPFGMPDTASMMAWLDAVRQRRQGWMQAA